LLQPNVMMFTLSLFTDRVFIHPDIYREAKVAGFSLRNVIMVY